MSGDASFGTVRSSIALDIYTFPKTRRTYAYAALPRSHKPTTRPFYGHASTVESGFQEDDFDEDDDLEYGEEEYIEIVDDTDFEFGEYRATQADSATADELVRAAPL